MKIWVYHDFPVVKVPCIWGYVPDNIPIYNSALKQIPCPFRYVWAQIFFHFNRQCMLGFAASRKKQ